LRVNCELRNEKLEKSKYTMNEKQNVSEQTTNMPRPFAQTYFHGTKANLNIGDFIQVGYRSNYEDRNLRHVYVTSTLHTAILGAELGLGNERERIYLVEATGTVEDDPNVTDKKFPGNPTMSYRSEYPFKVLGEVIGWQGHTPEQIETIKNGLKKLIEQGTGGIID
jgi:rifampin ADP-ribosylating transferase